MAWSSSDLTALESAIKSGARRVRYDNHEVEYQDLSEMLRLRDLMRTEIAAATSSTSGSAIYAGRIP